MVSNRIRFHGEDLLAPRSSPKLRDHVLSAVRDSLFSIFAATLHIGDRSFIRNLRTRHAVVTGTHLSHLDVWGLKREMLIVDWSDCIIRNFMIGTHQIYYLGVLLKKNGMSRVCFTCGGEEKCVQDLVGKPEGKGPLGRRRLRCEDNIKIDRQEVGF